jgi:glycoside/pentoside/hexuronide:cation symporter, GPH family
MSKEEPSLLKKAFFYSFYQISDVTAYQSFILLIFTFYFSVVGIGTGWIVLGYAIWSVWNAINDPLLGYISDKTNTKWGRRRPWIIIGSIPLAISIFLLYTPPLTAPLLSFIYFFIIIIIFELFYTMFSLNSTSLFPEVFITEKERTTSNNVRQLFTIIGLIFAFILPGIIIPDFTDVIYLPEYQFYGLLACIIVAVTAIIFILYGPREKLEFRADSKTAFSLINTLKHCLKSRSFRWYIPAEICNWFVYGLLPTLVPLYAKHVLKITDALTTSIMLGLTFLSAAIFMTFLWKPVVRKMGNRKAWMLSMSIWIVSLAPLMFISEMISGMIVFFIIGIGLSGSFYIIDLIVADIVDEDEIVTSMRREAGYFGVNAFFLRFSNLLVILAIGLVFSGTDWSGGYVPNPGVNVEIGLRILMFVFPAIALSIGILSMYKYPLDGDRLKQVKINLQGLHEQKKARL